jgi:hypothetical protein
MLDEEPGVMRRLQGVLMDGHDANKFFKKADKAADAVKDAISTKVSRLSVAVGSSLSVSAGSSMAAEHSRLCMMCVLLKQCSSM